MMAYLPLRSVSLPETPEQTFDAWLADIEARLAAFLLAGRGGLRPSPRPGDGRE